MWLGVPVFLRDATTMDDVGLVHVPPPVEPDDVVRLADGWPLRVVAVLGPVVPALVEAEATSYGPSGNAA